jgi:membrane protease YdiL (CAAX protease family)
MPLSPAGSPLPCRRGAREEPAPPPRRSTRSERSRVLDFSRVRGGKWYAVTLVTMPLIATAAYGVMHVLDRDVPRLDVPWSAVPGMSLMILVAAAAEELGWSGYATPRMQERMTALQTGLLLGVATAVWHLVPLLEVGRAPEWPCGKPATWWQRVSCSWGSTTPPVAASRLPLCATPR